MNLLESLIVIFIISGAAYMTFETSHEVKNQYEAYQLQQLKYIKKDNP
jgi:hypothetical protein